MPRVSIWLIRASLIHFLSGAVLGAAYLSLKATGWPLFAASHRPVHVEEMLIGWLVQLVIGVAYWMLPSRPEAARSPPHRTMWTVFVLLNLGVLTAALGGDPRLPEGLLFTGRLMETAAVALFGVVAWNRQRPYTPRARKLLV